jgi:hypothetical protein
MLLDMATEVIGLAGGLLVLVAGLLPTGGDVNNTADTVLSVQLWLGIGVAVLQMIVALFQRSRGAHSRRTQKRTLPRRTFISPVVLPGVVTLPTTVECFSAARPILIRRHETPKRLVVEICSGRQHP